MSQKIEHEGVISGVKDSIVYVNIIQTSACAGCHAKTMCSISEQKEKTIEIPAIESSFQVGDKVLITGNTSHGLIAVVYAFILPLIFMVFALIIVISYSQSEGIAALAAISFLIIYYTVLYFFREKLKKKFVFSVTKHI